MLSDGLILTDAGRLCQALKSVTQNAIHFAFSRCQRVVAITKLNLPAHILVNAWMTIHLCSKLLVGDSRMYKKISLKNTYTQSAEYYNVYILQIFILKIHKQILK